MLGRVNSTMRPRHTSDTKVRPLQTEIGQALMRFRSSFVGIGVFSFFINLLMLTGPLYMLQVYDRVLLSSSVETLVGLSILMAAMFAFMGLLEWVRARVLARVSDDFGRSLGANIFERWIRSGRSGTNTNRPVDDLSTLKTFLAGNAPTTFFDIPWVPIFILAIFILHPALGWLAVFGAVVLTASAIYNEVTTRGATLEALSVARTERGFSEQVIRNAEAVSALGMAPALAGRWKTLNDEAAEKTLLATDRRGSATAFTKGFRMFIQSAILGLGGYYAIKGIITPGAMIAGSIIMGRALAPLQQAIAQWRGVLAARDAFSRLNEFVDGAPSLENPMALPEPKGHLSVQDLTAGPPGATLAVIQGVSFDLQPGDGLGIVGNSASGKTTLARLLTGIWIPQRGSVRLDGATLDQYPPEVLGRYIGYLPQDVELFTGTIAENISRFLPDAKEPDIWAAAKLAGVHDIILSFPNGYDSLIGKGGIVLSGGQTQRIALARAVYGTPKLIVLDEPNASLDSAGDLALSNCIKGLRDAGSTVIVIAHRRSALLHVDKLLELESGKPLLYGPKDQVLQAIAERQGKGGPNVKPISGRAQVPAPAPASPTQPQARKGSGPMGLISGNSNPGGPATAFNRRKP